MGKFKPIWKSVEGTKELWQYRQHGGTYYGADFSPVWQATLVYEGGYEQQTTDNGSWTGGVQGSGNLIGSNMGISAPTLSKYLGRTATVSDMQNLTKQQAQDIAKKYYWDTIQGDAINSEAVAHAVFDAEWASGGNGLKIVRQAINTVAGSNVVDGNSTAMSINNTELGYLNSLDSSQLFNTILNLRNNYDNSLSSASIYGKGWKNRLDAIYEKYAGSFVSKVGNFIKVNQKPILYIGAAVALLISISLIATISSTSKAAAAVPATV